MGLDEPKEAADIRRAEEHGSHKGRIGTQKSGQCWRNRQKIGKDREDIEIKNNKLIKKSLKGTILALIYPTMLVR